MRSSNVCVLGVFAIASLAACSVSTTGNSITFKTQTEFVDSSQAPKTSTAAWNGEPITISNDGVNPLTGTGGIVVNVDPTATNISVKAIFSARADDNAHKDEADASIADAIGTFQLTEGGSFNIKCGHGQAHGTSGVATSGCKLLTVTIPAGSATQPHTLSIGDGNGGISFSGSVYASKLTVTENGQGDVSVKVNPVTDANIVVTGSNAVKVAVPSDFSSKVVTLNVGGESDANSAAAKARIITTDFPDMVNGGSYPTSGATATAAAQLNVQTTGLLDDYTVTIAKQ
jgi:hypothetical protein